MRRILFVDDEPRVLEGLRRMLHSLRGEWHMEFAQSGQEALKSLDMKELDVMSATCACRRWTAPSC